MWDNRDSKKNPKAPDYKCRDKSCDGVIWPPRNGAAPVRGGQTPAAPVKQPHAAGPYIPEIDGEPLPTEKLDHLFAVYAAVEAHVLATSVPKFNQADVGTTPESVASQIHTLFIAATKAGV